MKTILVISIFPFWVIVSCTPRCALDLREADQEVYFGILDRETPEISMDFDRSRIGKGRLKKFRLKLLSESDRNFLLNTVRSDFEPGFSGTGWKIFRRSEYRLFDHRQLIFVIRMKEENRIIILAKRKPHSKTIGLSVGRIEFGNDGFVTYYSDCFYVSENPALFDHFLEDVEFPKQIDLFSLLFQPLPH